MTAVVSVALATVALAGCDEATNWEAFGSWSGVLAVSGEDPMSTSASVYTGDRTRPRTRIRLCGLDSVTFDLPFAGAVRGEPAAVRIQTPDALCRTGRRAIGGVVLVWSPVGQDTLTLSATPSEVWQLSGEIDVREYLESDLPDLDVGESAITEMLSGTLTITATDGSGRTFGLEQAAFDLQVTARRFEVSIS
jgi:hypothetical protein